MPPVSVVEVQVGRADVSVERLNEEAAWQRAVGSMQMDLAQTKSVFSGGDPYEDEAPGQDLVVPSNSAAESEVWRAEVRGTTDVGTSESERGGSRTSEKSSLHGDTSVPRRAPVRGFFEVPLEG